jgi:hypothetical protein
LTRLAPARNACTQNALQEVRLQPRKIALLKDQQIHKQLSAEFFTPGPARSKDIKLKLDLDEPNCSEELDATLGQVMAVTCWGCACPGSAPVASHTAGWRRLPVHQLAGPHKRRTAQSAQGISLPATHL